MTTGGMGEIIALEDVIRCALPAADAAAGDSPAVRRAVMIAQDVLCNGWTGPGSRLDCLRAVAGQMRPLL